MTYEEILEASRYNESVRFDKDACDRWNGQPLAEGILDYTWTVKNVRKLQTCTIALLQVREEYNNAYVMEVDSSLFSLLRLCKDEPKTEKNDIYCSCTEPNKMHNIGIGTLDFWVCKTCRKEIK